MYITFLLNPKFLHMKIFYNCLSLILFVFVFTTNQLIAQDLNSDPSNSTNILPKPINNSNDEINRSFSPTNSQTTSNQFYGFEGFTDNIITNALNGPYAPLNLSEDISPYFFAGDMDADGNLYGYDALTLELYKIDIITGEPSLVGPVLGIPTGTFITGISWNPANSQWYAITQTGTESLILTLDVNTAEVSPVGTATSDLAIPIWLAIDNNGVAFAADIATDQLYTVDLTSSAATVIGPLGLDISFAQDADFDPNTNELYAQLVNSGIPLDVWQIDTSTGAATSLYNANYLPLFSIAPNDLCPSEDVVLRSQAEINAFAAAYPNCPDIPVGIFITEDMATSGDVMDLSPLSFIQTIDGHLVFWKAPSITSLSGLENLTSVSGVLGLNWLSGLTDLNGLSGLESVGWMQIASVRNLMSLDGLSSLQMIQEKLVITNNQNLSSCAILPVCNLLDAGKPARIARNGTGCNTVAQVETDCMFDERFAGEIVEVEVFPNPVSATVVIDDLPLNSDQSVVNIFDQYGQLVKTIDSPSQKGGLFTIDVSNLKTGFYYLQISDEEISYTSSFLKM